MGARRLPPPPHPPVAGECSGCTATRAGQLRDGRGRPDLRGSARALRRPDHRQAVGRFAPGARSSSTSTSTPAEISKERPPRHIPIVGRCQARAGEAADRSTARSGPDPERLAGLVEQDRGLAREVPARLRGFGPTTRSSRSTWSRRCTRRPAARAIVTSDVGQHQMWARAVLRLPRAHAAGSTSGRPRHDGLRPACRPMGAAVGCPDRLVCLHRRRRLGPG